MISSYWKLTQVCEQEVLGLFHMGLSITCLDSSTAQWPSYKNMLPNSSKEVKAISFLKTRPRNWHSFLFTVIYWSKPPHIPNSRRRDINPHLWMGRISNTFRTMFFKLSHKCSLNEIIVYIFTFSVSRCLTGIGLSPRLSEFSSLKCPSSLTSYRFFSKIESLSYVLQSLVIRIHYKYKFPP